MPPPPQPYPEASRRSGTFLQSLRKRHVAARRRRMIAGLAFAFLCLTGGVVPPATRAEVNENRAEMLVHGSGTATGSRLEPQSVRDSERYEQLLHPDPGFRAVR